MDGDWCRGMENAVGYFMCWAIFILSTLLTLVLSVVVAVLKLLVIWPSILLVCLMLGMNLRLFLLFPSFLTWVGKWLLGLDEHQAKVAKCIHDEPGTNRRGVGRGDPSDSHHSHQRDSEEGSRAELRHAVSRRMVCHHDQRTGTDAISLASGVQHIQIRRAMASSSRALLPRWDSILPTNLDFRA